MDAKKLFGLQRTSEDKNWVWFLDPENYRPVLSNLGVDEADFCEAWRQVLQAFPLEWVRRVSSKQGASFSWSGLHPPHLCWLSNHPVALFLAHRPYGWATAAPLIRLGLDLHRTRNILRIASVVRDLRDLEQYTGRLFELEALSELARRNWFPSIVGTPDFGFSVDGTSFLAEARHRGAPFGMAVARQVHPPIEADWHHLRVELETFAGTRQEAAAMANRVNAAIEDLLAPAHQIFGERSGDRFRVFHDDQGERRTVSFSYGSLGRFSDELHTLVYRTLLEKSRQLHNGPPDCRRVVLLDCRSLVRPEVSGAMNQSDKALKNAILAGGEQFLQETRWISGVIWWWPRNPWPSNLRTMIHQPDLVSLSLRGKHAEVLSAETLLGAS